MQRNGNAVYSGGGKGPNGGFVLCKMERHCAATVRQIRASCTAPPAKDNGEAGNCPSLPERNRRTVG